MSVVEPHVRELVMNRLAGTEHARTDSAPARATPPLCTVVAPARVLVPATTRGPWVAREFARSRLCPVHAADIEVEASMLVSELTKDAVRDGRAPVTVAVECWTSAIAVSVTARESNADVEPNPSRLLTTLLLDRLTVGWGIESLGAGLILWGLVPTVPGRVCLT